jgi:uncharacterized membrane protein YidH (DUF202 family)
MQSWARFRTAGALAACAYAVHSLRYTLAYGSHAGTELHRQGHAYLAGAPVLLTGLLALGAGELVRAAARGERAAETRPSLARMWVLGAVALMAIFGIQESLEGLLATGHPAGLAAVLGGGGWLAVPLAVAFGLLVAVLDRGARAVLSGTAARLRLAAPRPPALRISFVAPVGCAPQRAIALRRGRAPPSVAGL